MMIKSLIGHLGRALRFWFLPSPPPPAPPPAPVARSTWYVYLSSFHAYPGQDSFVSPRVAPRPQLHTKAYYPYLTHKEANVRRQD